MASFSDDFNRSDSSDLGVDWVEESGDWAIASSQLSPGTTGSTVVLRAATAMDTDDHYVQVTIAGTAAVSHGVWCRGNSDITSGYVVRNNGTNWALFSVVAGSFTSIGTFAGAAVPDDVVKLQAVGSTIEVLINDVTRISVTDTDVATGASVGVRSEANSFIAFDDFTAADSLTVVTGTALGAFGALVATAAGTRETFGTASATFGGLTATATSGAAVTAPQGSWDSLLGMLQEARDIDREERSTPPTSCATCYTALREGPDGRLYCPWDGLVWPDDASAWGEFPGSY